MRKLILVLFSFLIWTLNSCTTSKKMVYVNDLKTDSILSAELLSSKNVFEAPIQKNDLLWISVGGPNSQDLIALNSGLGIPASGAAVVNAAGQVFGYLVESDGNVKIPYLGKIKVEGLTRVQLESELAEKFAEYTKDPVVNIRFMNYRVTVLGEVLRPSTFTIQNERITILEALGMAGDLTVMGKRESVLIVREVNGKREFGRINLLSKDLFTSPFYYLKTNDVVYVEPASAKFFARERLPQFISLAAGSLSLFAILLSLNK